MSEADYGPLALFLMVTGLLVVVLRKFDRWAGELDSENDFGVECSKDDQ